MRFDLVADVLRWLDPESMVKVQTASGPVHYEMMRTWRDVRVEHERFRLDFNTLCAPYSIDWSANTFYVSATVDRDMIMVNVLTVCDRQFTRGSYGMTRASFKNPSVADMFRHYGRLLPVPVRELDKYSTRVRPAGGPSDSQLLMCVLAMNWSLSDLRSPGVLSITPVRM